MSRLTNRGRSFEALEMEPTRDDEHNDDEHGLLLDSRDTVYLEAPPPSTMLQDCFPCLAALSVLVLVLLTVSLWTPARQAANDDVSCRRFPHASTIIERTASLTDEERCWHGPSVCACKNPTLPYVPQSGEDRQGWAEGWQTAHQANLQRLEDRLQRKGPLQLVMYGDSITEHWNGVSMGRPNQVYAENSEVLHEFFDADEVLAMGVSGDRAPQVLARLAPSGGELPSKLFPDFFLVLIGTNDYISDGCSVDAVVTGNLAVVQAIRQVRHKTPIVVSSVLPRTISRDSSTLLNKDDYLRINEKLRCYTSAMEGVHFLDMWYSFLDETHTSVNMTLLPDGLHPTAEGSRVWARAIRAKLDELRRSP